MKICRSRSVIRRKTAAAAMLIVAVFLLALILTVCPQNVAEAVLPESYVAEVINADKEWWTAEQFLNLAELKSTVRKWFDNPAYNFAALESDPIRVAVIDTGMQYRHSIFMGKYDENGKSVSVNGVGKYDVLLRDGDGEIIRKNTSSTPYTSDITDNHSERHGSHVAGIIAALIHSLELEKYIKIMPVKATDGRKFYSSSFKAAVEFAIEKNADVVNMSISTEEPNFTGFDISEDWAKETVFVAAAGNSYSKAAYYPGASSNVIGVMNYKSDSSGKPVMSETSNYGEYYDICAPGTDIYSVGAASNDAYAALSGTSMASPIVAFAAALTTLKFRALGEDKTKEQIADIIRTSSGSTIKYKDDDYKVLDINALMQSDKIYFGAQIVLEDEKLEVQRLGSIKEVKMALNVSPVKYQGLGSVEWYVNDVKANSGENEFEFEYLPPSECGDIRICAIWTPPLEGEEKTVSEYTLKIDYMQIDSGTIETLETEVLTGSGDLASNDFRVNENYTFCVDTQNMSPSDVGKLMWYVNGEFKEGGVSQFTFKPERAGEYTIEVKINSLSIPVAAFTVLDNKIEKEQKISNSLKYLTIVLSVAIAAAVAAIIMLILVKKKNTDQKP